MNEDTARMLKPGDRVWVGTTVDGQYQYTQWEVYEPPPERRFDNDPTIICYLIDRQWNIQSYVFSNQLYRYSFRQPLI